jgi:hypothetical protein
MTLQDKITFVWRVTAAHTLAYFAAGIFAIAVLRYEELFGEGSLSFMRPTDSPWVAAGPALQIVRGAVLGAVLLPFRSVFLTKARGWLYFWLLLFVLTYLLTASAAVGSFEGVIYTTIPLRVHLLGLPEILLYLTLFTGVLWIWYRRPARWLSRTMGALVVVIVLLSGLGVLSALGWVSPQ